MLIIDKKLVDKGQRKFGFPFNLGDFLLNIVHVLRLYGPCAFTHMSKSKKKTLTLPTSSPLTRRALLRNFARHQLLSWWPSPTSMTVVGGWRSRSKWHKILSLLLPAAYLHRLSTLYFSEVFGGIFGGLGLGIFLSEKVINLAEYLLISYHSPFAPVNQPTKIVVDSFFF